MSDGTKDDAKGRVKEAAGAITGDDSLKREGKVDQAAGKAKKLIDEAADKADNIVEHGKD